MQPQRLPRTEILTHIFERVLLVMAALVPAAGTVYLAFFGSGNLVFMEYSFHEVAIAISLVCSGFATFVALRCYKVSGERFLLWLMLAFEGETMVYAPHGILTRLSHDHMALFLIYGPMSRLVMAALLMVGLLQYDKPRAGSRAAQPLLWRWILIFLIIDAALGWAAWSHPAWMPHLRLVLEFGALAITLAAVVMLLLRPKRSPLMQLYTFSLIAFATASGTFLLAHPWTHLWWYAHVVFAAGFLLLSYGVLQAFHSTGAFSDVFSQQQMMERLREEKQRTEEMNLQLHEANEMLEVLATTDSLTGASNRRHFLQQAQRELERARRSGDGLTILLADIDHFKQINDCFGHEMGDRVLTDVTAKLATMLRSNDLMGRIGGEEFAILLPDTAPEQAAVAAERMRMALHEMEWGDAGAARPQVSISVGIASLGRDGDNVPALLRAADARLYAAKNAGRDQVVWT
ncbi:MAG TPA: diguanylate cyclase [Stenotrophobium sp.]|nr:diguanylate cyclase [Stenotrophobium sp.]